MARGERIADAIRARGIGGTVMSRPVAGNPNHCEIGGLTVSQIKGVWTMCTVAAGCP